MSFKIFSLSEAVSSHTRSEFRSSSAIVAVLIFEFEVFEAIWVRDSVFVAAFVESGSGYEGEFIQSYTQFTRSS